MCFIHLPQHCRFVRPGTNVAIAAQSLQSYVHTASFNFLSSSAVHFPARAVVGLMLETKVPGHLVRHCEFVRPGTSAVIISQFLPPYVCTASFNLLSSSSAHLPTCRRRVDVGSEHITLSLTTLLSRSTWYQHGNCSPILAIVR
jgi:hypothetical protein